MTDRDSATAVVSLDSAEGNDTLKSKLSTYSVSVLRVLITESHVSVSMVQKLEPKLLLNVGGEVGPSSESDGAILFLFIFSFESVDECDLRVSFLWQETYCAICWRKANEIHARC